MFLSRRLNPLAAVADQALLSLLNFAVSLAFIWGATKVEYGHYLLLLAPLLLVQGVQNAIVNSPLATFLPAAAEIEKKNILSTAVLLNLYLALACGFLGLLGLLAYGLLTHFRLNGLLVAGFTLAIIGTIARESQRSFAYVQGKGLRALVGDLVYGVVLLTSVGFALADSSLTAGIVLLLTGIAGLVPLFLRLMRFQGPQTHTASIKKFWSCGRWALPSVIVTWVNLSSYPYFAEKSLDLAAVADIGVSRLFLMPIGLMMTAWSNWYRPQISQWFYAGDVDAIKRITFISLFSGVVLMGLLAIFLFTAYPIFEPFLGPQYSGLQPLMLMWLLYFAIAFSRNVYMATLMVDANGYKTLHHITWMSLALSMPGFILFSHNGALWVVGVLCVTELAQVLMVVTKAKCYWARPKVAN